MTVFIAVPYVSKLEQEQGVYIQVNTTGMYTHVYSHRAWLGVAICQRAVP
jgi:hypothetical protein